MLLPIDIDTVKGFLDPAEGRTLYEAALATARLGPALEIGSYCGKSAVYIGTARREAGGLLSSPMDAGSRPKLVCSKQERNWSLLSAQASL